MSDFIVKIVKFGIVYDTDMKSVLKYAFATLFALIAVNLDAQIKVISYNIRLSIADDGENSWQYRKSASIDMIEEERPDIFGLQEAMPEQVTYLNGNLPDYRSVGVGREDGVDEGEHMMIYYNSSKISLSEWGTYWLSETPDVPSLGWGAACKRTATWTKLCYLPTGQEFYYVNTHLDHVSALARRNGLKLIVENIKAMNKEGLPLIVTGDFNVQPTDDSLDGIESIMSSARTHALKTTDRGSFNGWGRYGESDAAPVGASEWKDLSLDYIYYTNFKGCLEFKVLDTPYGDVKYISDHYPVSAVLVF